MIGVRRPFSLAALDGANLSASGVRKKLKLMRGAAENFYAALKAAGMPEVPEEFSVVWRHQVIPNAILDGISDFIRCFDRVTAREAW